MYQWSRIALKLFMRTVPVTSLSFSCHKFLVISKWNPDGGISIIGGVPIRVKPPLNIKNHQKKNS